MTDERDDIDPADWLSSQFGEEPEAPARTPLDRPRRVPPAPPTPPASAPAAEGTAFRWGLTPGGSPTSPASAAPDGEPTVALPPLIPPVEPPAAPPAADWDTPTVASPVIPAAAYDPPTVAYPAGEVARQEFPGLGTPVDRALDGATEVLGAQAVGLPVPVDEGVEASAIDALFGDSNFVDYPDEPIIAPLASRSSNAVAVVDRPRPAAPAGASIPRVQKVLLGIAGGVVAVLALVALFLLGTRIAGSAPVPVASPSAAPSSSAEPGVLPAGPLAAGEYGWDELAGGECLAPFESAWQDNYTVVDCTAPHPAQLLHRGEFEDASGVAYPGVDELQTRITALCTSPQIIDYAATGGATDIEISASFPADEQDWLDGNRTYFCFADRTGGTDFTNSIAVPQA